MFRRVESGRLCLSVPLLENLARASYRSLSTAEYLYLVILLGNLNLFARKKSSFHDAQDVFPSQSCPHSDGQQTKAHIAQRKRGKKPEISRESTPSACTKKRTTSVHFFVSPVLVMSHRMGRRLFARWFRINGKNEATGRKDGVALFDLIYFQWALYLAEMYTSSRAHISERDEQRTTTRRRRFDEFIIVTIQNFQTRADKCALFAQFWYPLNLENLF